MYIYISPICNVEARLLYREYNKIRDSLFSLFTWYQSQRENLIYFFSDCVSFRSLSSPPGTLRRRISSSLPQPSPLPMTFRATLLQLETTDSEAHEADLQAGGNPVGKQHRTRRHAPPFSCSLPSTHRRVDPFPVTGLHIQGRPAPSCCSISLAVYPEPSLSTFLPIFPPPPSVSHLLHGLGPFFFFISSSTAMISSSTVVIRPPIRALFNPNVIQSPVKWIWQLKILFLLMLSLDLLLSHQKN